MAQAISTDEAIAVSDGSFAAGRSTSAFILTTRHRPPPNFPVITAHNVVPGQAEEQDSYRAELGGLLGVVTLVDILCKTHNLHQGSIEVALDNKSAHDAVFERGRPHAGQKAYDLILSIKRTLKQIPIQVKSRHVFGHQDEVKPRRNLSRWETLNCTVDQVAKRILRRIRKQPPPTPAPNPQETLIVTFRGHKLSCINKQHLYNEIYGDYIKDKWCQLAHIPTSLIHNGIHWSAQHRAMKQEPFGKKRFLVKFFAHQAATGRALLRRKHQDHDRCPRCDAPNEDTHHVLTCPSPEAAKCWSQALTDLHLWMQSVNTEPSIAEAIRQKLDGWHNGHNSHVHTHDPTLSRALSQQDKIGWENFLLGRISPSFGCLQNIHYQQMGSRRNGNSWTSQLITQCYALIWTMWEHRNHIRVNDLTAQDRRHLRALRNQIHREFKLGKSTLLPADKWLLSHKGNLLNKSIEELTAWLDKISAARDTWRATAQAQQDDLQAQQAGLQRWLHPPTQQ